MRIALAGAGAFGLKHLDALARIDGVEIAAVVSRRLDQAQDVARNYGAPMASTELEDVLRSPDVDAVILATPTQMHAQQAIETLRAGKHVQVEIPSPIRGPTPSPSPRRNAKRGSCAWSVTPGDSILRTSGSTNELAPVS